jgi:hypothetical protein
MKICDRKTLAAFFVGALGLVGRDRATPQEILWEG